MKRRNKEFKTSKSDYSQSSRITPKAKKVESVSMANCHGRRLIFVVSSLEWLLVMGKTGMHPSSAYWDEGGVRVDTPTACCTKRLHFFFLSPHLTCVILAPEAGISATTPALEVQSQPLDQERSSTVLSSSLGRLSEARGVLASVSLAPRKDFSSRGHRCKHRRTDGVGPTSS